MHRRFIATLSAALLLSPAAAFAASATQDTYDNGAVLNETDNGSSSDNKPSQPATPSATSNSSLPFTGLEAGLIAAAGLGLAGTGLVLRRSTREQA